MRTIMAGCAALAFWLGFPAPATLQAQESLEQAILRQAPKLIRFFTEHRYKNVGVLKFLVNREGQKTLSDNTGTLNLLLARQLEVALVLDDPPATPIGIIVNASAVAQNTPGASHLTKEGRLKLLDASYPPAWGDQKVEVKADAFVTGVATISADLKTMTVSLLTFDRQTNKLEQPLPAFAAANRADQLSEMGESFVMRGGFDDGQTELTSPANQQQKAILHEAARVHAKQAVHPARQANVPVTLVVYYDGKPVPLEVRDGKAYIPEPQEGQKVELELKRDGSKDRYGVVLKVNGENTIDKQRQPDFYCRRWILDPGAGPATIDGYLLGTKTKEKFRVLSAAESKAREVNYGPDVGTITMTVFREARGKERPEDISDEAAKEKVLATLPDPQKLKVRPQNHSALVANLLDDANKRGLIGEGDQVPVNVDVVPFRADPRPVMCLTVVYYKRQ